MRIIAGTYRSRRIQAPEGTDTRPTLDKVREAVFSSLGGMFEGGMFLDLYAGSGANGLEAVSRGCSKAVFNDLSGRAYRTIKKNIETLGCGEQTEVYHMKDTALLNRLSGGHIQFGYVYLDPPYSGQKNIKIMNMLQDLSLLEDDARVIVESAKEDEYPADAGRLHRYKEAVYGITKISYYVYSHEE